MSKLSHIEDVEQRAEAQHETPDAPAEKPVHPHGDQDPQPFSITASAAELPAEEDEEFHGLDSTQPMGALHKALIAIAAVVVVVAILYIVNSWIHFV